MRKTLVYTFLFLANIILVAHNAIPHHHHNKQVCVENSHCHPFENHSCEESLPDEGHSHDGDQKTTDCILKQDIVRPYNNWKLNAESIVHNDNQLQYFSFYFAKDPDKESIPLNCRKIFIHENTLSISTLIACSAGLRAPPLF